LRNAMVSLPFFDREDAGRQLAGALAHFAGTQPVVLAIPRGGVPIGKIVANALHGDLDVVLVRKIGAPNHPEFAIGAIDEQGSVMLSDDAIRAGADNDYVREEAKRQLTVIRERRAKYARLCGAEKPANLQGRVVIVVDDGLATGATMTAALQTAKKQNPRRLICAVPVAARDSLAAVAEWADEVVCLATPEPFMAVGRFYREFSSVSEEEVLKLLKQTPDDSMRAENVRYRPVQVDSNGVVLDGDLALPSSARGQVLFVHGSGSGRHSPRNRFVAGTLNQLGFATLLFDLLTVREDRDPAMRFDISLLTTRLQMVLDWALADHDLATLRVGLFGASTGAAAALRVAANRPDEVRAVVSRGGRADLAGDVALGKVEAPTLLIVGSEDHEVLALNRRAQQSMPHVAELVVVRGATHLFEEPGALERVADEAGKWFSKWLVGGPASAAKSAFTKT
jgi:putative phosphoribosyl transferase